MRGKVIFLVLPLLVCTAASKPKPTLFRWALTYDIRLDKVNGAPPEKPKSVHSKQSACDTAISEAELGLILLNGITDSDGCKMEHIHFADGKISFDGGCPKDADGMFFTAQGTGTYSDTALHIDVRARGEDDEDSMEASGTVIGVRGGPC